MRIFAVALAAFAFSSPAFSADLNGPNAQPRTATPTYTHRPVHIHKGAFAAVAVSTDLRKDAYGFQFNKNSAAGAERDAISFCEERFALKGLRGGHCAVKSTTEYVVGMYCRDRHAPAGIGTGTTPEEAAREALASVGGVNIRRCDFKAMRHGTLNKFVIDAEQWSAGFRCRGREYAARAHGAIAALNVVLKQCGDIQAAQVVVLGLNHH